MITYKNTPDGRAIGVDILMLDAFPEITGYGGTLHENIQDHAAQFQSLIKEFHTLIADDRAVMEILWVTDAAADQAYKSNIRIFLILREIGYSQAIIHTELSTIHQRIVTLLRTRKYAVTEEGTIEQIRRYTALVNTDHIYALKKKVKYTVSPIMQAPLFYCDVLQKDLSHNYEAMISILSEQTDCAVSFQIIPAGLQPQELMVLGEVSSYYKNISLGRFNGTITGPDISAEDPAACLNEYYQKSDHGLFQYGIVVYGNQFACTSFVNLFHGMITNIKGKNVEFDVIDLRGKPVDLYTDFYTYPWNLAIIMNQYMMTNQSMNNAEYIIRKVSLLMTSEELLSYYGLPMHSQNTLALKENRGYDLSEQLSDSVVDKDNIQFGYVRTVNGNIQIGCPPKVFAKHALIVGTPGTGKTTFSLNILLQFYRHNIPFLAIEPTKTEYRALIDRIPELQIFTPGNNEVSPFIINPFAPPQGIKVEQYIPALISAFSAAFSMPNPLDTLFLKAIRTAYNRYGWKDYSRFGDHGTQAFGLYEFVLIFKQLIKESNYSREVKGNLESGGTFRLMNLIEQNGNIYDTTKTIPIEDLLTKPTIVELNAIQGQEQKSLIMALLLSSICLYTKIIQQGDGTLKNVMLIDEAHVLLDGASRVSYDNKSDAQGATVKSLQAMAAEIRSYGTGIIIADQSAKKVSREIVANTDIKVVFRLVEKEEKDIINNSINGNADTYARMSKLKMGEAFVFWSTFDSPQLVYTPDIREQESVRLAVPDEEIMNRMHYWDQHKRLLCPYTECGYCGQCREDCNYYIRSDANHYAEKCFYAWRDKFVDENILSKYLVNMNRLLENYKQQYTEEEYERLIDCCRIYLWRKARMELNLRLSNQRLKQILMMGNKSVYDIHKERGEEENG